MEKLKRLSCYSAFIYTEEGLFDRLGRTFCLPHLDSVDSLKFSRLFPLPEGKREETAEFQTIGLISTGDMISLSLVVSPTRWS